MGKTREFGIASPERWLKAYVELKWFRDFVLTKVWLASEDVSQDRSQPTEVSAMACAAMTGPHQGTQPGLELWNCLDGVQCDYAGDTSHRYRQMKEAAKQTMASTCSAEDGSEGLSEEQARSCFLVNCGPANFVAVVGNLELRETGVSRANVCVLAASNGPLINFVVAAFSFYIKK